MNKIPHYCSFTGVSVQTFSNFSENPSLNIIGAWLLDKHLCTAQFYVRLLNEMHTGCRLACTQFIEKVLLSTTIHWYNLVCVLCVCVCVCICVYLEPTNNCLLTWDDDILSWECYNLPVYYMLPAINIMDELRLSLVRKCVTSTF